MLTNKRPEIKNIIRAYQDRKEIDRFEENVTHYIWTVKDVKDVLEMNGLKSLK